MESYALSCSLLPLSLLLDSLGIHLMLILIFRARHVDERMIWVRSLKSRDRPRLNTIEGLSLRSNLQSCTGWLWAAWVL